MYLGEINVLPSKLSSDTFEQPLKIIMIAKKLYSGKHFLFLMRFLSITQNKK